MTIDELVRKIVREELALYPQVMPDTPATTLAPSPTPVTPPPAITPAAGPPAGPPPIAPPGAVTPPPATYGPVPTPPVPGGPPVPTGAPSAPVPPTVAAAPPAAAQAAIPVQPVPNLNEIRGMANDFARQHPDKQVLFSQFMASKGVSSLADMPPAEYPACKAELLRLMTG